MCKHQLRRRLLITIHGACIDLCETCRVVLEDNAVTIKREFHIYNNNGPPRPIKLYDSDLAHSVLRPLENRLKGTR